MGETIEEMSRSLNFVQAEVRRVVKLGREGVTEKWPISRHPPFSLECLQAHAVALRRRIRKRAEEISETQNGNKE